MVLKDVDGFTQPSFGARNRVGRAVWGVVWLLLFRPSPKPMHAWRAMLLRLFGAQLGRDVHCYPAVKIWAPWQLVVGNRVGIANGVTLYNMAPMSIGDNVVISQGAHLCGGSHDINSGNFQLIARPIKVERYCWICADAFIGHGVQIAEGCVVGARSVVLRSISEPWTVWSGHPAINVRSRSLNILQGSAS